MSKRYIPSGYTVLTPYLCCSNASDAIKFYCRALGAKEEGQRWLDPSGKVGHAELSFGGQKIFISDPYPQIGVAPPTGSHKVAHKLCLYVPNLEACVENCIRYGATILESIKEQKGLGTRTARISDPMGHVWILSTKVSDRSSKDTKASQRRSSKSGSKSGKV